MSTLRLIQFNKRKYPLPFSAQIEEIAGHFDTKVIKTKLPAYSLHTEYSFSSRKFSSPYLSPFSELKSAEFQGVPQLWKSEAWAIEFAQFLHKMTESVIQPKIIEIHPPFTDYITEIDRFINIYTQFEFKVSNSFPKTEILLENRSGTLYRKGRFRFLIENNSDIDQLSTIIDRNNLRLRIALDIPQLFTSQKINPKNIDESAIKCILNPIKKYRPSIFFLNPKKLLDHHHHFHYSWVFLILYSLYSFYFQYLHFFFFLFALFLYLGQF